jgi:hypothetical protein
MQHIREIEIWLWMVERAVVRQLPTVIEETTKICDASKSPDRDSPGAVPVVQPE